MDCPRIFCVCAVGLEVIQLLAQRLLLHPRDFNAPDYSYRAWISTIRDRELVSVLEYKTRSPRIEPETSESAVRYSTNFTSGWVIVVEFH